MTPADNTAWRTAGPDAWVDDTTDVLHCSMPPQVRQHIEELRAEVVRLTAHAQQIEVPHSSAAVLGYVLVVDDPTGPVWLDSNDGEAFPTTDGALDLAAELNLRGGTPSVAAVVRVGAGGRIT